MSGPQNPHATETRRIGARPLPLLRHEAKTLRLMRAQVSKNQEYRPGLVSRFLEIGNGHYLRLRPLMIEWMVRAAEQFEIEEVTLHVAIQHVDKVLSEAFVAAKEVMLCSGLCLLTFAKKSDPVGFGAHVQAVKEFLRGNPATSIDKMNRLVHRLLEWEADPTPIQVLDVFMTILRRITSAPREEIDRYEMKTYNILHQLLYHAALTASASPQHIAAAALYLARKVSKSNSLWPQEYATATGVERSEIASLAGLLEGSLLLSAQLRGLSFDPALEVANVDGPTA
jgi:Cyclin, N-terminal domain/Cyclin, C-terminal domain